MEEEKSLPDYVFDEKFDHFYFFLIDVAFGIETAAFFDFMSCLEKSLNQDAFFITNSYGIPKDTTEINILTNNRDNWWESEIDSVKFFLITSTQNVNLFDNTHLWGAYTDRTLDIVLFGIKEEIKDKFTQALIILHQNKAKYEIHILMERYIAWYREIFTKSLGKSTVDKFCEKMKENYNK